MHESGRALPGRVYAVGACAVLFLLLAEVVGHSWIPLNGGPILRWEASRIPVHMRLVNLGSPWTAAAIEALRAWNSAGARFQLSWGQSSRGGPSCSQANGSRSAGCGLIVRMLSAASCRPAPTSSPRSACRGCHARRRPRPCSGPQYDPAPPPRPLGPISDLPLTGISRQRLVLAPPHRRARPFPGRARSGA